MDQQPQKIRLKLPEQDLQVLTVGSDQPKKLKAWVDELPLVNMGETSRQLYQFIQELNRLQIGTPQRLQLLEVVRPVIEHVCSSLGKHYLNQSLVLPEKARRVASLAQALQNHLAGGYKMVAVRQLKRLRERDGKANLALAIHRAMTALTETLVRSYQLYFPTPRHLWLEMHQLYLLAEMHGVQDMEVADAEFRDIESSSVADAYARVLLLATAKPNQLRQQEIAVLYRATEEWSGYVEIKHAWDEDDLFVFDLQQDRAPTYRTHVSVAGAESRYIDSRLLIGKLGQVAAGTTPEGFHVPKGINDNLLAHLQQAWGALTERSFKRVGQTGDVDLSLGLNALHLHLAGGMEFERVLKGDRLEVLADGAGENPFLINKQAGGSPRPGMQDDDAWSRAFDGGSHRMSNDLAVDTIDFSHITSAMKQAAEQNQSTAKLEHLSCQKVNASPGGYCLQWQGEAPAQMRTGEILGVREIGQNEWAIGVVRWVKQLAQQGAQFGVELLAPRAMPVGARVIRKTGDAGTFMRALVLPALHAIGQPATLLVPSVGFQSGAKVEMAVAGESQRIVLGRKVNSTASFGQYEYRQGQGGTAAPDAEEREGGEDFDSIWSSL
jgi:hypothetical protein